MKLFDKVESFGNMSRLFAVVAILASAALSLIGIGGAVVGGDVGNLVLAGAIILIGLGGAFFEEDIREGALIVLGSKQARLSQLEQGLQAIQEADPNFNLEIFCEGAAGALVRLNQALDEGRLELVRAFLSDGIYERLVFRHEEEATLGPG